jgi:hypothetical protein
MCANDANYWHCVSDLKSLRLLGLWFLCRIINIFLDYHHYNSVTIRLREAKDRIFVGEFEVK